MIESILPFVQEVNVGYITIICMAFENAKYQQSRSTTLVLQIEMTSFPYLSMSLLVLSLWTV